MNRYHRQQILPQIGEAGQLAISSARVLLVGCGALGTVIAEQLARAGVGFLRIVDRDIVELTNLQRQVLFDESDVRDAKPKAIAAADRLRAINSNIEIDARVMDVDSDNIESFLDKIDLIMDGTDNVATRYLINDAAIKHNLSWVYGACVGVEGRVMPIVPGKSACLRCMFPDPPAASELPTCDTAGVLASAASIVASMQVVEAIKLLLGTSDPKLLSIDVWSQRTSAIDASRREDCLTCAKRRFEFLDRAPASNAQLCGRNAVQIRAINGAVSLEAIEQKLATIARDVHRTSHLLRCSIDDSQLTIFPDGRAIVHGTNDIARARSIYSRYVGA